MLYEVITNVLPGEIGSPFVLLKLEIGIPLLFRRARYRIVHVQPGIISGYTELPVQFAGSQKFYSFVYKMSGIP